MTATQYAAIVVVQLITLSLLVFGLVRQNTIYRLKNETYSLLVIIKEWAELGKRAHESSLQQVARTAAKTEQLQQTATQVKSAVDKIPDAMDKIPDAVVEKMGGPQSSAGITAPWSKPD